MSVTVLKLADAITTNTPGPIVDIPPPSGRDETLIQIQISATITVTINGRVGPEAEFVEVVAARTASEIVPIAWCPQLQVVTSGVSGGEANVFVAIPWG